MKTSILRAAFLTPSSMGWGLPLLVWSMPGEAKTSMIEELAVEFGCPCEVLSPGERGEGAFGVVPVPVDGYLDYPAPSWTKKFADGGLVFVDEVTTAAPALQPPLLGLIHAKRIGATTLGPRVRTMGAANPPEYAAGGFELPPALANRFGHIEWEAPTVEEHAAYMMRAEMGSGSAVKAKTTLKDAEEAVLKAWPEPWAKARGLESAFLLRRRHLKNACPKVSDSASGRGWPSDRSWENATRALASAEVHALAQSEREEFIASFIGNGAANEFFTFISKADLPNPADVLDGKVKFVHSSARVDRTFATLNACAALVTSPKAEKRAERADALWGILHALSKSGSDTDVVIPCGMALVKASLHTSKTAIKAMGDLDKFTVLAGVTANG